MNQLYMWTVWYEMPDQNGEFDDEYPVENFTLVITKGHEPELAKDVAQRRFPDAKILRASSIE